MKELKESLGKLEKSELVDALVELAGKKDGAYAFVADLVAKSNTKKGSAPNDELMLKGMQNDLQSRLRKTEKRAEEDCGDAYHYYDDSARVHDVEAVHKKYIVGGRISSPSLKLQALCELADELMPSLEGRIYDFDGDRVLLDLDKSVVQIIKTCKASEISEIPSEIIMKVTKVFSEDYRRWQSAQGYGLFVDAPSKLKAGNLASTY